MNNLELIWGIFIGLSILIDLGIAVVLTKRIKKLKRKTDMLDREAASTFRELHYMKKYWR